MKWNQNPEWVKTFTLLLLGESEYKNRGTLDANGFTAVVPRA